MEDFRQIDDKFYIAKYGLPKVGDPDKLWDEIKNNKELLKWAVKPTKNRFGYDTVNGIAICDSMLYCFNDVDPEIYNELVDLIYKNIEIARISIGNLSAFSPGLYTYLLMTLWNPNLKLTPEQKEFAVNDVGKCQHGHTDYDIRYWILRNSNWTKKEKKKLIKEFYCDDESYEYLLENWEIDVVNDLNYKVKYGSQFARYEIYDISDEQLLKISGDEKIAAEIRSDIEFCRLMHEIRPSQYGILYGDGIKQKKKKYAKNN